MDKSAFKRLSHPYNDCYNDFSLINTTLVKRTMKSGRTYTQKSCFSLCVRRTQTEKCNCSIPVEYELEGLPSCRLKNYTKCLIEVKFY